MSTNSARGRGGRGTTRKVFVAQKAKPIASDVQIHEANSKASQLKNLTEELEKVSAQMKQLSIKRDQLQQQIGNVSRSISSIQKRGRPSGRGHGARGEGKGTSILGSMSGGLLILFIFGLFAQGFGANIPDKNPERPPKPKIVTEIYPNLKIADEPDSPDDIMTPSEFDAFLVSLYRPKPIDWEHSRRKRDLDKKLTGRPLIGSVSGDKYCDQVKLTGYSSADCMAETSCNHHSTFKYLPLSGRHCPYGYSEMVIDSNGKRRVFVGDRKERCSLRCLDDNVLTDLILDQPSVIACVCPIATAMSGTPPMFEKGNHTVTRNEILIGADYIRITMTMGTFSFAHRYNKFTDCRWGLANLNDDGEVLGKFYCKVPPSIPNPFETLNDVISSVHFSHVLNAMISVLVVLLFSFLQRPLLGVVVSIIIFLYVPVYASCTVEGTVDVVDEVSSNSTHKIYSGKFYVSVGDCISFGGSTKMVIKGLHHVRSYVSEGSIPSGVMANCQSIDWNCPGKTNTVCNSPKKSCVDKCKSLNQFHFHRCGTEKTWPGSGCFLSGAANVYSDVCLELPTKFDQYISLFSLTNSGDQFFVEVEVHRGKDVVTKSLSSNGYSIGALLDIELIKLHPNMFTIYPQIAFSGTGFRCSMFTHYPDKYCPGSYENKTQKFSPNNVHCLEPVWNWMDDHFMVNYDEFTGASYYSQNFYDCGKGIGMAYENGFYGQTSLDFRYEVNNAYLEIRASVPIDHPTIEMCRSVEKLVMGVSPGYKDYYGYTIVSISGETNSNVDCIIGFGLDKCVVSGTSEVAVKQTFNAQFKVVCGFYTPTKIVVRAKDGNHDLEIRGKFSRDIDFAVKNFAKTLSVYGKNITIGFGDAFGFFGSGMQDLWHKFTSWFHFGRITTYIICGIFAYLSLQCLLVGAVYLAIVFAAIGVMFVLPIATASPIDVVQDGTNFVFRCLDFISFFSVFTTSYDVDLCFYWASNVLYSYVLSDCLMNFAIIYLLVSVARDPSMYRKLKLVLKDVRRRRYHEVLEFSPLYRFFVCFFPTQDKYATPHSFHSLHSGYYRLDGSIFTSNYAKLTDEDIKRALSIGRQERSSTNVRIGDNFMFYNSECDAIICCKHQISKLSSFVVQKVDFDVVVVSNIGLNSPRVCYARTLKKESNYNFVFDYVCTEEGKKELSYQVTSGNHVAWSYDGLDHFSLVGLSGALIQTTTGSYIQSIADKKNKHVSRSRNPQGDYIFTSGGDDLWTEYLNVPRSALDDYRRLRLTPIVGSTNIEFAIGESELSGADGPGWKNVLPVSFYELSNVQMIFDRIQLQVGILKTKGKVEIVNVLIPNIWKGKRDVEDILGFLGEKLDVKFCLGFVRSENTATVVEGTAVARRQPTNVEASTTTSSGRISGLWVDNTYNYFTDENVSLSKIQETLEQYMGSEFELEIESFIHRSDLPITDLACAGFNLLLLKKLRVRKFKEAEINDLINKYNESSAFANLVTVFGVNKNQRFFLTRLIGSTRNCLLHGEPISRTVVSGMFALFTDYSATFNMEDVALGPDETMTVKKINDLLTETYRGFSSMFSGKARSYLEQNRRNVFTRNEEYIEHLICSTTDIMLFSHLANDVLYEGDEELLIDLINECKPIKIKVEKPDNEKVIKIVTMVQEITSGPGWVVNSNVQLSENFKPRELWHEINELRGNNRVTVVWSATGTQTGPVMNLVSDESIEGVFQSDVNLMRLGYSVMQGDIGYVICWLHLHNYRVHFESALYDRFTLHTIKELHLKHYKPSIVFNLVDTDEAHYTNMLSSIRITSDTRPWNRSAESWYTLRANSAIQPRTISLDYKTFEEDDVLKPTWLDDRYSISARIFSANQCGSAYISGNTLITNEHVTHGNDVYLSKKSEESHIGYKFSKPSICNSDRDLCIYGENKLEMPNVGDYYALFSMVDSRTAFFECVSTKAKCDDEERAFVMFRPVKIDFETRVITPNREWTKKPGLSGTAFISHDGLPVGIYGCSKFVTVAGEAESMYMSSAPVNLEDFTAYFRDAANEVVNTQLTHEQMYYILEAPTGTGKTTTFTIEMWKKCATGVNKSLLLLQPTRAAALNAYRNMETACKDLGDDYSVSLSLGGDITEHFGKGKVALTVMSYGKFLAACGNNVYQHVHKYDAIICDEIHMRTDTTIVEMHMHVMRHSIFAKTWGMGPIPILVTATDINFGRYGRRLNGTRSISAERYYVHSEKVVQEKHERAGCILFKPSEFIKSKQLDGITFNIPKKDFEQQRTLIFVHSIKAAQNMAKWLEERVAVPVFAYYANCGLDTTQLPNPCVVVCTDALGVSVTIADVHMVVDLGFEVKPKYYYNASGGSWFYKSEMETKVISLQTHKQRRGRTGRTCEGTVYFIFDHEEDTEPWPSSILIQTVFNAGSRDHVMFEHKILMELYDKDLQASALGIWGWMKPQTPVAQEKMMNCRNLQRDPVGLYLKPYISEEWLTIQKSKSVEHDFLQHCQSTAENIKWVSKYETFFKGTEKCETEDEVDKRMKHDGKIVNSLINEVRRDRIKDQFLLDMLAITTSPKEATINLFKQKLQRKQKTKKQLSKEQKKLDKDRQDREYTSSSAYSSENATTIWLGVTTSLAAAIAGNVAINGWLDAYGNRYVVKASYSRTSEIGAIMANSPLWDKNDQVVHSTIMTCLNSIGKWIKRQFMNVKSFFSRFMKSRSTEASGTEIDRVIAMLIAKSVSFYQTLGTIGTISAGAFTAGIGLWFDNLCTSLGRVGAVALACITTTIITWLGGPIVGVCSTLMSTLSYVIRGCLTSTTHYQRMKLLDSQWGNNGLNLILGGAAGTTVGYLWGPHITQLFTNAHRASQHTGLENYLETINSGRVPSMGHGGIISSARHLYKLLLGVMVTGKTSKDSAIAAILSILGNFGGASTMQIMAITASVIVMVATRMVLQSFLKNDIQNAANVKVAAGYDDMKRYCIDMSIPDKFDLVIDIIATVANPWSIVPILIGTMQNVWTGVDARVALHQALSDYGGVNLIAGLIPSIWNLFSNMFQSLPDTNLESGGWNIIFTAISGFTSIGWLAMQFPSIRNWFSSNAKNKESANGDSCSYLDGVDKRVYNKLKEILSDTNHNLYDVVKECRELANKTLVTEEAIKKLTDYMNSLGEEYIYSMEDVTAGIQHLKPSWNVFSCLWFKVKKAFSWMWERLAKAVNWFFKLIKKIFTCGWRSAGETFAEGVKDAVATSIPFLHRRIYAESGGPVVANRSCNNEIILRLRETLLRLRSPELAVGGDLIDEILEGMQNTLSEVTSKLDWNSLSPYNAKTFSITSNLDIEAYKISGYALSNLVSGVATCSQASDGGLTVDLNYTTLDYYVDWSTNWVHMAFSLTGCDINIFIVNDGKSTHGVGVCTGTASAIIKKHLMSYLEGLLPVGLFSVTFNGVDIEKTVKMITNENIRDCALGWLSRVNKKKGGFGSVIRAGIGGMARDMSDGFVKKQSDYLMQIREITLQFYQLLLDEPAVIRKYYVDHAMDYTQDFRTSHKIEFTAQGWLDAVRNDYKEGNRRPKTIPSDPSLIEIDEQLDLKGYEIFNSITQTYVGTIGESDMCPCKKQDLLFEDYTTAIWGPGMQLSEFKTRMRDMGIIVYWTKGGVEFVCSHLGTCGCSVYVDEEREIIYGKSCPSHEFSTVRSALAHDKRREAVRNNFVVNLLSFKNRMHKIELSDADEKVALPESGIKAEEKGEESTGSIGSVELVVAAKSKKWGVSWKKKKNRKEESLTWMSQFMYVLTALGVFASGYITTTLIAAPFEYTSWFKGRKKRRAVIPTEVDPKAFDKDQTKKKEVRRDVSPTPAIRRNSSPTPVSTTSHDPPKQSSSRSSPIPSTSGIKSFWNSDDDSSEAAYKTIKFLPQKGSYAEKFCKGIVDAIDRLFFRFRPRTILGLGTKR